MPLRILHISDLHAQFTEKSDWRRERVLGAEWRNNVAAMHREEPIDLVCLTGDVAYAGKRDEYKQATPFILGLLRDLGLGRDRLFVVPGNHDVDRAVNPGQYVGLRTVVDHNVDRVALAKWMGNRGAPPAGIDQAWRDAVLERQAQYEYFVSHDLELGHLHPSRSTHGRLGYRVRVSIPGFDPIHVIGLNTAWLSGDRDSGNLIATDEQVMQLATDAGRSLPGLKIVLMHHSFSDLIDGRDAQRSLAGHVDLVLRGHYHLYDGQVHTDHDRRFVEFAATALFDPGAGDQYANGCQLVTVEARRGELSGNIWVRSWSPRGYWYDDNAPYKNMHNGRLSWTLRSASLPSPSFPGLARLAGPSRDISLADYQRAARRRVARDGFSSGLVRPDRVYVSQPGTRLGDSTATRIPLLDSVASVWLTERRRVMVLGNYGMGKTFFALRAVMQQLDAMNDPGFAHVPVYFPLRQVDCGAALSAEILIKKDIVDQILQSLFLLDFPKVERSEFLELVRAGKLTFVLDGLDELNLPRDVSWTRILQPLLSIPEARCVVTSRTAYVDKEKDLAGWDVYEMQDWARGEWLDYVERSSAEFSASEQRDAFVAAVDRLPQLAKLTTRPLWCFMMVRIHERIEEVRNWGIADLYQEFLDDALERVTRQFDVSNQILGPYERYMALERFAETCTAEGRTELSETRFMQLLSAMFSELGFSRLEQFLAKEVKVYSFINCDRQDRFTFGHASFTDYFLAASLARMLITSMHRNTGGSARRLMAQAFIARHAFSSEQVEFLAGILASENACESLGILDPRTPFDEHRTQFHEFVRELLSVPASDELARNVFLGYLRMLRGPSCARPKVTALSLQGVRLPAADLSDCDFLDVDFSQANLARADFRASTLAGCQFAQATLDEADFTGADLANADFSYMEPAVSPPRVAGALNLASSLADEETKRNLRTWSNSSGLD